MSNPRHERGERVFLDGIGVRKRFYIPAYSASTLPSSPAGQSLFFDTDRNVPVWWDGSNYERPNFTQDVLTTPPDPVTNTTAKTTVWEPDVDAGSMVEGRKYQLDLMGKFSTANTSDTFTVHVDIEGTDVANITNVGANVTDAPWSVELNMTVQDDTGTIQPHVKGLFDSQPDDNHVSSVNIDTATATTFSVSLEWDAADPGNSVTLGQGHLVQMA